MKHVALPDHPGWEAEMDEAGFPYHSVNGGFWVDNAAISISEEEASEIEMAVPEVYSLCLDVIPKALNNGILDQMGLQREIQDEIWASWRRAEPVTRSRFDLSVLPGASGQIEIKVWECNSDTPTTMPESGPGQEAWFKRRSTQNPDLVHGRQINSLFDDLVCAYAALPEEFGRRIAFMSDHRSIEDYSNCAFLLRAAEQAGFEGWHEDLCLMEIEDGGRMFGGDGEALALVDKLYPWEFLFEDSFNRWPSKSGATKVIEPAWKIIMSSKIFWVHAWAQENGHPNLLPTFMSNDPNPDYKNEFPAGFIKKPIFSREGANCSIFGPSGELEAQSFGVYGAEGFIVQAKAMPCHIPKAGYVSCGAWHVNNKAAGIIMRVTESPICEDMFSRDIPHFVSC